MAGQFPAYALLATVGKQADLSRQSFNEGGCFSPGSFAVLIGVA